MFKSAITAGALATGLIAIGSTTADARSDNARVDKEMIRIDEQFSVVDDVLSPLCGFEIIRSLDTQGRVRVWGDRVHVTEHGSLTLSNPENGKSLTNEWRGTFKRQATETFNYDDNTVTVEFRNSNSGIPERWRDSDGKILIADLGRVVVEGSAVFDLGDDPNDPSDDTLVPGSEVFEVTTNGPHPIFEGGLDPSLACDLLA